MKKSLSTTILHFQDKPNLLPPNIYASTIQSLISFCLDNSYFEFNGQFYSQDTGGTMGSPLVVELAEIRVADVENRKPTHTNLYVRYNSCAPSSSKDSVIRSLTRRAHILCSPQHLQKELDTVYTTSLQNGHPPDRVKRIMDSVKQKLENPNKLTLKQFNRQLKATTPSLTASFPFHPTITKKIKKSLASHDVKVTSSSGTTLRDLLTKTKTTPPPHLTPNVIYEISCNDCTATYNGQTNRPLIKRIKEHESHSRLHLHNPDDFSHNQSAPAHHSRTTGHKIAWDRTTILTTTRYKTQLDLTEHTAIKTRNPSLNRTDSAPTCSKLWDPIIPKIACTIKPRPAGISFPKKK